MILITGTNGFLGSYLAKKLLSQGKKVRGLKRATSDLSLLGEYASQIEWITGDILDVVALEEAMHGVDEVFHCAAVISFAKKDVANMMKANVEGTANVMNVALAEGVKRVLHVSSVAAFGLHKAGYVIDESTVYAERSDMIHYYRSKQMSEREAWRAQAEGLDVVVANPSTILGAGRWDMEPISIFKDVYEGLSFYTNGTVGFVDVRDVVDCLLLLMEKGKSGHQYIISAEDLSFKHMLHEIADIMGVGRARIPVSERIAKAAVAVEWIKSKVTSKRPLVTLETARLANMNFRFSNEKVTNEFGFIFRPMKNTIAETAKAFMTSKQQGKSFAVFEGEF